MIFIDHTEVLEGQVAVVDLAGPLDSDSSTEFEEYANRILDGETRYIILNMEKVDYISSAGIGLILYLQKTINRLGGYFVIFNLNAEIQSLFSLLGFDRVLSMAETRIESMEIIDRQMELRGGELTDSENIAESKTEAEKNQDFTKIPPSPQQTEENIPLHSQPKEEREPSLKPEAAVHFDPFIIECNHCNSLIRIKAPGTYLCPDCSASFTVNNEMAVSYG